MDASDVIRKIGIPRVALAAGVSRPAVHKWTRIPVARVPAVEPLFLPHGLDRYDLRPDIFGRRPASVRKPVKATKRKAG